MTVYTVQEVAEILKLSDATVRKLIHDNEIEYVKVHKSYRVTQEQLDKFLRSN